MQQKKVCQKHLLMLFMSQSQNKWNDDVHYCSNNPIQGNKNAILRNVIPKTLNKILEQNNEEQTRHHPKSFRHPRCWTMWFKVSLLIFRFMSSAISLICKHYDCSLFRRHNLVNVFSSTCFVRFLDLLILKE